MDWFDPTGEPFYGVFLCDRCHRAFLYSQLRRDGNLPGLMVCKDDWDELDPYRLPPRQPDNLVLPFVRPDVDIATQPPVTVVGIRVTEDDDTRITQDDDTRIVQ